ncbi:hypothetical protein [Gracilibacillus saliphilus]|uniref:hypothetical protein n=1 Tax=Gracilibacillus saliphilus TaxID=543890 RepID=UPI0013D11A66|nr:hypothetical protein [Gracilibacillus saliphilus]
MELTSKGTGKILTILLTLGVVLSSILVFTTFFYAYFYDFFASFLASIDQAISVIYLVIFIITGVFYLVWIYKVHKDLRSINSQYPITPGGALARIMIPIYNIYGLWNVFSTMGNYFGDYSSTVKQAKIITALLPYYYILYWLTNILDRLIVRGHIINDHVIVSSYVLDTVLVVIYLCMTKYILESLQIMSTEITSNSKSQIEAT